MLRGLGDVVRAVVGKPGAATVDHVSAAIRRHGLVRHRDRSERRHPADRPRPGVRIDLVSTTGARPSPATDRAEQEIRVGAGPSSRDVRSVAVVPIDGRCPIDGRGIGGRTARRTSDRTARSVPPGVREQRCELSALLADGTGQLPYSTLGRRDRRRSDLLQPGRHPLPQPLRMHDCFARHLAVVRLRHAQSLRQIPLGQAQPHPCVLDRSCKVRHCVTGSCIVECIYS